MQSFQLYTHKYSQIITRQQHLQLVSLIAITQFYTTVQNTYFIEGKIFKFPEHRQLLIDRLEEDSYYLDQYAKELQNEV